VVIIDANNILKTYIVRAISMHTDIHMNNRDARSVLHACPADSAQGRRQLAAADYLVSRAEIELHDTVKHHTDDLIIHYSIRF
jgi:hypothetical protein